MSDKTQEDYDLEKVYDEEVAPLMTQLLAICKKNNIPMLATFAYRRSNEEDETSFCTSYLAFSGRSPMELVEARSALNGRSPEIFAFTITTQETVKKS